jgi:hypothetical protein
MIIHHGQKRVFHIDDEHKWVKGEFAAFQAAEAESRYAEPMKYEYLKLTPAECAVLLAASPTKLIVLINDKNEYVATDCRLTKKQAARLMNAYLLNADVGGGWRLSSSGSQVVQYLNARTVITA